MNLKTIQCQILMNNTEIKWYNNKPTLVALITKFISTALSLINVFISIAK